MNALENIFKDKEIVIFCGCGGVGKTTVSSILSFYIASFKKRVGLLAIDPAMRLAKALGLSESIDDFVTVKVPNSNIAIKAQMLNPQEASKKFFQRFQHEGSNFAEVSAHPLFSKLLSATIGTPEYLAIAELGQLKKKSEFDVIVLDTPPTKQVLDFLQSTRRAIDLFNDKKKLVLFLAPLKGATKVGISIVNLWLRVIARLLNIKALNDLYEFMVIFARIIDEDGIIKESNYIESLLKDKKTSFFVVTSPKEKEIEETIYLSNLLIKSGYNLSGFFINKTLPDFGDKKTNSTRANNNAKANNNSIINKIYEKADIKYKDFLLDLKEEEKNIKKLVSTYPDLPFFTIPTILSNLHTPKNLYESIKSIKNYH